MKYGRIKIGFLAAALAVACLLLPFAARHVEAAEAETGYIGYIGYSKEDVAGGILTIPAGSYGTIYLDQTIKDAVVYLDDVAVLEKLFVANHNMGTIHVVLTGETTIGKVVLKGNALISAPDTKLRIRTVSVRNKVTLALRARAKYVSITEEAEGANIQSGQELNYVVDCGRNTTLVASGAVQSFAVSGSGLQASLQGGGTEVSLGGEANRVVLASQVQSASLSGVRNVLSVEGEGSLRHLDLKASDYKLIREEKIVEISGDAWVSGMEAETSAAPAPGTSGTGTFDGTGESKAACKYLFVGDSYTERLYTHGYLAEGIESLCASGSSPRDWFEITGKELDFLSRLPEYEPEAVVYLYGINNIKYSFNITYSKKLLEELMKQYPDTPIYVQRIFPVANTYSKMRVYTYDEMNRDGTYNVEQYNRELESFCAGYGQLKWIDTTEGFLDGNGDLAKDKTDDGVHLNDAAYAEWWEQVQKALSEAGMADGNRAAAMVDAGLQVQPGRAMPAGPKSAAGQHSMSMLCQGISLHSRLYVRHNLWNQIYYKVGRTDGWNEFGDTL